MIDRGYGEAAERIQELYLAGRQEEAAAAVPDEYVDEESLIGPPDRIRRRLGAWREAGVDELKVRFTTTDVLELMAELAAD